MNDGFSEEEHYKMLDNEVANVTVKFMNYSDYLSMGFSEEVVRNLTGLTSEMIEKHSALFNSLTNNQNK